MTKKELLKLPQLSLWKYVHSALKIYLTPLQKKNEYFSTNLLNQLLFLFY